MRFLIVIFFIIKDKCQNIIQLCLILYIFTILISRKVLTKKVECDTHLYYARHGKYQTENEELDKAYEEKQKKQFTVKQHEGKKCDN